MKTFTLDNGLQCVVTRRPASAMATVNILYNVGARDESRTLTGMAHLFEHLMFGGSANAPSFDRELEAAGGNSNAWTSNDFTNFYDVLPAANIATALHLESDRMLAPALTGHALEVQKAVVIEEFKQTHLNRPYGDVGHRLRAMLYNPEHPYSWPTIGLVPEHVAAVTPADAERWFYSHYGPDNAILSIVAPQPEEEIEKLVRLWFSDVPRRGIAPRVLPEPGFPKADVAVEVADQTVPQPFIVRAYPMARYGTHEYFAADTLTDILAAGRSSRLWRNLMYGPDEGLFAGVDASISGSEHEGMLMIQASLNDGAGRKDVVRAIELIDAQLRMLAEPGNITAREFERTMNNFEATYAFEGLGAGDLAVRRALALYHGEDPDAIVADRRKLTPGQLTASASAIFSRPKATLVYI